MRKHWQRTTALIFYILVIIFFISYIKNLDLNLAKKFDIKYHCLLFTLFLSLLARLLMPFTWITLIKECGEKIKSIKTLHYIYAKSWLGRYIPGKVAWIGDKIFFGAGQRINKGVLTVSSFLEAGVQICIGLLFGTSLIFFSDNLGNINPKLQSFIGLTSLFLLAGIFPPILNRILDLSYKLIKRKKLNRKYKLKFSSFIKVAGLFVIIQLIVGTAFGSIAKSVGVNLNFSNSLYLVGAIILSGVIGMLAVFAPSGIGVREGIQAVLLTPIILKEQAVVNYSFISNNRRYR